MGTILTKEGNTIRDIRVVHMTWDEYSSWVEGDPHAFDDLAVQLEQDVHFNADSEHTREYYVVLKFSREGV